MYGIEIKPNGHWKELGPPGGGPPYRFATREEAETMARILYPAMKSAGRAVNLRIVEVPNG